MMIRAVAENILIIFCFFEMRVFMIFLFYKLLICLVAYYVWPTSINFTSFVLNCEVG